MLVVLFFVTGSAQSQNISATFIDTNYTRGDNLLVLRIAISSTGEYTQEAGGAAMVNARINTVLAHINEVYGREY